MLSKGILHSEARRYAQQDRERELGDSNAYMDIFNLNKDQLSDPDKIKPGQVLKIPAGAHK